MLAKLQWLWRRISDSCTVHDILDLFGWKSLVLAMISGGASAFITILKDAPSWAVWLAGLAGALIALGIIVIWQNARTSLALKNASIRDSDPIKGITHELERHRWKDQVRSFLKIRAQQQATLKIEYTYEEVPNEGFFNWFTDGQGRNLQRYKIRIHNTSAKPIENVEIKLETIEEVEAEMCGIKPISKKHVGYHLMFEKTGLCTATILGRDREWVPVLSYEKQIFGHVSIEGVDKKDGGIDMTGKIMSPSKPHRIKLVARGTGTKEDVALFYVRLEPPIGGSQRLTMKQLEG